MHEMQENPAGAGRVATRRKSILGERHTRAKARVGRVLGKFKEERRRPA